MWRKAGLQWLIAARTHAHITTLRHLFCTNICIDAPAALRHTHRSKRCYCPGLPSLINCLEVFCAGREEWQTEYCHRGTMSQHTHSRNASAHTHSLGNHDISINKMNGMLTQYAWSQNTVPKFPAKKKPRIHHMLGKLLQKVYVCSYAAL